MHIKVSQVFSPVKPETLTSAGGGGGGEEERGERPLVRRSKAQRTN